MKLYIQVYGTQHIVDLIPKLPIQFGMEKPETYDGPQDIPWLNESLTAHCMGGGTIIAFGAHRFVALHVNTWRFE